MARTPKKVNTFAGYQEGKQSGREELIRKYLIVAKKSRAQFAYPTDLAKMVAAHISNVQGVPCSHTTLLRNLRYRALIFGYQAEEILPGAINQVVSKSTANAVEQAQVTQLQLSLRNLASDNQRLKAHISSFKSSVQPAQLIVPAVTSSQDVDMEEKFISTCVALLRVLEKFGDFVSVDTDAKKIMDLEPRPHKVLVDERLASPFISWLLSNRTVSNG